MLFQQIRGICLIPNYSPLIIKYRSTVLIYSILFIEQILFLFKIKFILSWITFLGFWRELIKNWTAIMSLFFFYLSEGIFHRFQIRTTTILITVIKFNSTPAPTESIFHKPSFVWHWNKNRLDQQTRTSNWEIIIYSFIIRWKHWYL